MHMNIFRRWEKLNFDVSNLGRLIVYHSILPLHVATKREAEPTSFSIPRHRFDHWHRFCLFYIFDLPPAVFQADQSGSEHNSRLKAETMSDNCTILYICSNRNSINFVKTPEIWSVCSQRSKSLATLVTQQ